MQDAKLFKDYTMQEVLDEFDSIESFEFPGHAIQSGEITRKQIDLYRRMGVETPTSLQQA
nr:MAG: hypothetical protein CR997_13925 [Acidobacteriota bacterium]